MTKVWKFDMLFSLNDLFEILNKTKSSDDEIDNYDVFRTCNSIQFCVYINIHNCSYIPFFLVSNRSILLEFS